MVGDVILFFSANCFILKKRKKPRKVLFLKIFFTDFGSHESLVKKDTYFMKKLDAFMNK